MEIKVHDLLKINTKGLYEDIMPEWCLPCLKDAPYVIVRREERTEDQIPIGIRGGLRTQRYGTYISKEFVEDIISPESLINMKLWESSIHICEIGMKDKLVKIKNIMDNYDLKWGVGGSVGFELASNRNTAKSNSDLDIVIRLQSKISTTILKNIYDNLKTINIRVDCLIELPQGGVALKEYISGVTPIVMRTAHGMILTSTI